MKMRATILASPYQTADGRWRAHVRVASYSQPEIINVTKEHADLKPGDTITVEKHGSEWRAV